MNIQESFERLGKTVYLIVENRAFHGSFAAKPGDKESLAEPWISQGFQVVLSRFW